MICSVCGREMETIVSVDLALNIGEECDEITGEQCSWWACECGNRVKIESDDSWHHWSDPDESGGGA